MCQVWLEKGSIGIGMLGERVELKIKTKLPPCTPHTDLLTGFGLSGGKYAKVYLIK
jgi:hypothetical protein